MQLTLFVVKECPSSKRVEDKLREFVKDKKNLTLDVKDSRKDKSRNVMIVPALFIDNELYNYGEIDFEKLEEKLNCTQAAKKL